jgi:integrase
VLPKSETNPVKLTDANVTKLIRPTDKSDHIEFDDALPGFAARWRSGAKPSWIFQYRIGNRQRRRKIGVVGAMPASAARDIAVKWYSQTRLGVDPAATIEKTLAAQAETFGAGLDLYLARQAKRLRPRSLIEVRRHLLTHAKPLHRASLAEIGRRDVSRVVSRVAESSGPTAANRVGSSLAAYLAWCVREGWLDVNVAATINKLHEETRARVLTDDELRQIWQATGGNDPYSAIVRLLMLLGCRRAEIGGLRWSEIDFDAATITLPAGRVKNAKEHLIPLPAAAAEILKAQCRDGRDHVFSDRGRHGFRSWSRGKAALDARAGISPGWVLHDLRRTFSTRLNGELGVAPHIVEHLLNHISGRSAISRIYNRAIYASEKAAALALWAEHLVALVEDRPSKIVALRA